ncbi:MAG: hypothetical protein H0V18_00685 [Pyrinomonadaceae bacterium]|jgi:hypothetical protein|nr:hypothetical protein [Pyrinomonadaceae bacterium]
METYASEELIAQHTGEDIATVRQFVGTLCDYQEAGEGEPYDENAALEYISSHTDLSILSIACMFVQYVRYWIWRGMIEPEVYERVRSWADGIRQSGTQLKLPTEKKPRRCPIHSQ